MLRKTSLSGNSRSTRDRGALLVRQLRLFRKKSPRSYRHFQKVRGVPGHGGRAVQVSRRGPKRGGTLEYIFESDEENVPKTATKERIAEIAANFLTTFHGIQVGTLETQELRTAFTVAL